MGAGAQRSILRPAFQLHNGAMGFHSKNRRGRNPTRGAERASRGDEAVRIYGLHAAMAALSNPRRRVRAVYATLNAAERLQALPGFSAIQINSVAPRDLDRMVGADAVHQGVLLEADPLPEPGPDILEAARLVLLLDQVTDPHNVGAILRSSAAFGVDVLIMTARNSPPLSGVLAKAASGGLEHVPVLLVPNLARTLAELGEIGFWRIGLDSDGAEPLETVSPSEKQVLVLGSEDRGLRRLTREHCDIICALATSGPIRSLNVSNAAAIALHTLAVKQRGRPD